MIYQQEVIETRTYSVLYTVKASSIEDAMDKVAMGDTIAEQELRPHDVSSRDEWDNLLDVTDIYQPSPEGEARCAAFRASMNKAQGVEPNGE